MKHTHDAPAPLFDGSTFRPTLDADRLGRQLAAVLTLMRAGRWRTLGEIQQHVIGTDASISARLRDLRKERFGGYTVERRRRGEGERGVFEYRVGA